MSESVPLVQDLATGDLPFGVVANSRTNTVYVSSVLGAAISVIDGATNTVEATIPVGGQARWLAVDERSDRLFVSISGPRSIEIIDGATKTLVSTLNRTFEPLGVAADPVTGRLFVPNNLDGSLSVLDGSSFVELARLSVGTFASDVEFDPDSRKGYVSNFGRATVTILTDALDPTALLLELGERVMALNLRRGIENSLDAKLDNVLSALSDSVLDNDVSAANALDAFINQTLAQRGNQISESEADGLVADAQAILSVLR